MTKMLVALALVALPLSASTRKNDDTCDVAQMPAATLLLPYFEVGVSAPRAKAETTLFTITNTTREPRIAHITLWTDHGYPVLAWNAVLTGYDVYSVDLRYVLEGRVPASAQLDDTGCATVVQPPPRAFADAVRALTLGHNDACGGAEIGGKHLAAIGYATIDVVANCTTRFATDPAYAGDLLYDNVLTGDWMLVEPDAATGNYAAGNPLVHIRAVPEGGDAGVVAQTNLGDTFYHRYMPAAAPFADRGQPLPSRFVARTVGIYGSPIATDVIVWRGGPPVTACATAVDSVMEEVAFDERENPFAFDNGTGWEGIPWPPVLPWPRTSRVSSTDGIFPIGTSGDVGGWLYLNLDNAPTDLVPRATPPNQAWVTTTMSAGGRFMEMHDATPLGNGCSRGAEPTDVTPIGPAK